MSTESTPDATLEATEAWFRRQGVPHLTEDYSTRRDILTRTLPFLLGVLALEVLLNFSPAWPWWANVLSIVGAMVALTAVWIGINALRRRKLLSLPEQVGAVEALVFLLTAPALTGLIWGAWADAAFVLGMNALLLLGAYLTVGFALLPIFRWGRAAARPRRDRCVGSLCAGPAAAAAFLDVPVHQRRGMATRRARSSLESSLH